MEVDCNGGQDIGRGLWRCDVCPEEAENVHHIWGKKAHLTKLSHKRNVAFVKRLYEPEHPAPTSSQHNANTIRSATHPTTDASMDVSDGIQPIERSDLADNIITDNIDVDDDPLELPEDIPPPRITLRTTEPTPDWSKDPNMSFARMARMAGMTEKISEEWLNFITTVDVSQLKPSMWHIHEYEKSKMKDYELVCTFTNKYIKICEFL